MEGAHSPLKWENACNYMMAYQFHFNCDIRRAWQYPGGSVFLQCQTVVQDKSISNTLGVIIKCQSSWHHEYLHFKCCPGFAEKDQFWGFFLRHGRKKSIMWMKEKIPRQTVRVLVNVLPSAPPVSWDRHFAMFCSVISLTASNSSTKWEDLITVRKFSFVNEPSLHCKYNQNLAHIIPS